MPRPPAGTPVWSTGEDGSGYWRSVRADDFWFEALNGHAGLDAVAAVEDVLRELAIPFLHEALRVIGVREHKRSDAGNGDDYGQSSEGCPPAAGGFDFIVGPLNSQALAVATIAAAVRSRSTPRSQPKA